MVNIDHASLMCLFLTQGNACTRFASCHGSGLHCHHPRDCLNELRDETIEHLQQLLAVRKLFRLVKLSNVQ